MEQRLTMVTLGVSDLARSEQFYSTYFGWNKTSESNGNIVFYRLNGILLGLYPRKMLAEDAGISPEGMGFAGLTLSYNTRSEDEVDRFAETMREKGWPLMKDPQKTFWGGYHAYVVDPDGYPWEIAFNPFLPMDEKGNVI